jgi:hypothetical protein
MIRRISRWRLAIGAASAVAALATVAIVAGQAASGFDLSWNAITGGGGKSSGGGYVLQGAIIPVDGSSSGGSYALQGGFFAGEAIKIKKYLPEVAKDGAP